MRNVRNFWLELSVDGKQSRVDTGPRAKDGGFDLIVYVREDGDISDKSVHLRGRVGSDGTLQVNCTAPGSQRVLVETKR